MTYDKERKPPSPGARVLLVESRASTSYALLRCLSDHGFLVDVATDAGQAGEWIAERAYAIVLTSLHVGRSRDPQGLGILHLARDLLPGTRTILLTESASDAAASAARSLGVDRVLPEALPPDEVLRAVTELAGRRS